MINRVAFNYIFQGSKYLLGSSLWGKFVIIGFLDPYGGEVSISSE